MTTPVIIDIIVATVLFGFAIFGAKRGLFRALTGLVVVIVALVGAGMIAAAVAPQATKLVTPLLTNRLEEKVSSAMARQESETPAVQMPESDGDAFAISDLLALLGLDDDVRQSLGKTVEEKIHETGVTLATAIVESLAQSLIYGALYILSFFALTILLKLLMRAVDLVLQLPGLHGLNALGGGVIGLAEGALLLFLAIWALRRMGVSFETELFASTHLLRIFTTNTPLSLLSFLQ